jgi:orotate phosphoribosyltransferase-like protein
MEQGQQAQLDALRDAQRFLDTESTALSAVNHTSSRQALDDIIKEIEARGALQMQAATDALNGTKRKDELRDDLREHQMSLVAEIARAKLAHSPLISRFRVPRKRVNDSTIISAATAMVNAAEAVAENFTPDLGRDFATELRGRIDGFRDAVISRNHSQVLAKQTTQAVDDALGTARGIMRILNRMVLRETKGSPALWVGWRAAKHVKAKGGVPQGTFREVPVDAPAPEVKAAA